MRPLILVLLAYLLGSVPSGYLAGRWAGLDLRRHGSGNVGTSNVYRVVGAGAAFPVALADVLKGFVPVWYFGLWDASALPHLPLVYGVAAIAGHVWSPFLRFRGGKGIATAGGVVLALAPATAMVGMLVWAGLVLLTGAASVASLSAVTVAPFVAAGFEAPWSTVAFLTALIPFAYWTHRSNLARLWRHEEHRVGGGLRVPWRRSDVEGEGD